MWITGGIFESCSSNRRGGMLSAGCLIIMAAVMDELQPRRVSETFGARDGR